MLTDVFITRWDTLIDRRNLQQTRQNWIALFSLLVQVHRDQIKNEICISLQIQEYHDSRKDKSLGSKKHEW